MRCFSYAGGRVVDGIAVKQHEKLGFCASFGEDGRGRHLERVKLDQRRPPQVIDGRILDAGVLEFVAGGVKRHAFTAPGSPDGRILLDVDSDGPYTRGEGGYIVPMWGVPIQVAQGYGAWGDAGRLGTLAHELWLLGEGDAIFVKVAGGHKSGHAVLQNTAGKVDVWTNVDVWRSDVVVPWLTTATPEQVTAAVEFAARSNCHGLVRLLKEGQTERTL